MLAHYETRITPGVYKIIKNKPYDGVGYFHSVFQGKYEYTRLALGVGKPKIKQEMITYLTSQVPDNEMMGYHRMFKHFYENYIAPISSHAKELTPAVQPTL